MTQVYQVLETLNNFIWSPFFLMPLLIMTAIYFTIRLDFVQFKMFRQGLQTIANNEVNKSTNAISPMEAFLIGLASRIGTGNIVGVSLAIVTGGPGVIFWMWVVAIIVSASSFTESTLAQIFKEKEKRKGYVGGPSYYMAKGFKSKKLGRIAGIVFALLLVSSYGLVFVAIQSNTIAAAFSGLVGQMNTQASFDHLQLAVGILVAVLIAFILFGGASRIAKVSSIIVPIMAIGYLLLALLVAILNIQNLPLAIQAIFVNAFTPQAIFGTTVGGVIIIGAQRGMFSNEAGMGSAPNAAATATTDHPVNQGLIQALGVFVDTILVCTATGVIILTSLSQEQLASFVTMSQNSPQSFAPILVPQQALANTLGNIGVILLTIFIFCFAFSSMIGNYYYSESSLEFLSKKRIYINIFKVLILADIVIAAVAGSQIVWTLGNIGMGLMATVNLLGLIFLVKYVVPVLKDYRDQVKNKIKKPIFYDDNVPSLKGKTVWTRTRAQEENISD